MISETTLKTESNMVSWMWEVLHMSLTNFTTDWAQITIAQVHVQIPPTSYEGLILRSTAVATASRSTVEGTMRVLHWRMQDSMLPGCYGVLTNDIR